MQQDWNEMSNEEKWAQIKYQRDIYLQKCDWTQMPDAVLTIEEKATWQEYRQALRDAGVCESRQCGLACCAGSTIMKKADAKDTKKRDEGAKGKATRNTAVAKIQALRGTDINKMTAKEKEDLLIIVCQLLRLCDDKGIIQ